MKTIIDPVFGEMKYDHSWEGIHSVPGIGQLRIIAKAYSDEVISEAQRASYKSFLLNPTEFLASANLALSAYAMRIYPETDVSKLHPEGILFCQNGVWGFLYPSPTGEDDGLSVRFENGRAIADTDDALF